MNLLESPNHRAICSIRMSRNFAVLRDASETPFGLICSRFRNRSPGCPDFLGKNLVKNKISRFSPQIAGTWEQWNLAVLRAASETPFRRNASETPLYRTHACREQSPGGRGDFLDKASSKKKTTRSILPPNCGRLRAPP